MPLRAEMSSKDTDGVSGWREVRSKKNNAEAPATGKLRCGDRTRRTRRSVMLTRHLDPFGGDVVFRHHVGILPRRHRFRRAQILLELVRDLREMLFMPDAIPWRDRDP